MFYSLVVGIIVGVLSRSKVKYNRTLGLAIALATYKLANRLMHVDNDHKNGTGQNLPQ